MRFRFLVTLAALLACAAITSAQETTGEIVGTVRSTDGQPLPGATVTIEGLDTGFSRAVVAGLDGGYRFQSLPPRTYRLTATLDGFQSYRRNLHVDLGGTVTNPITLAVGSFNEFVEVTAETPLIDTATSVSGITVDTAELTAQVPLSRDVTQFALLAPGTVPGSAVFGSGNSYRGNLNTPGQQLVSFGGASINENSFIVNGLNITNLRDMMGSSFVPLEFVQEVQVKTGGYEAEYGRATGGVVNVITKTGTNTTHGATSFYWSPRDLQEQQPNVLDYNSAGEIGVSRYNQNEENSELEANLSLGGALVKDRLFYFAFLRYSDTDTLDVWRNQAQRSTTGDPYWGGKLDWTISPSHRLEGTYISDAVDVRVAGYGYDPVTDTLGTLVDTGSRFRGGDSFVAKYSGLLTESLLLAVQGGRNDFNRTDKPDGADVCPVAYDSRTGRRLRIGCWIDSSVGTDYDERVAFRADLDWYIGRHSLRAGADLERNESRRQRLDSGGVSYRYYVNGTRYKNLPKTTELVRVQHQIEDGTYEAGSRAAYVQDSWAATRNLTVNFGVRWEGYENTNAEGETFLEISDQLAPRLGVAWDVRGDGSSKLYGSLGVYHLPMSTRASINLGSSDYEDEGWYVLEGGINANGSPGGLGQQLDFIVLDDGIVADPREAVDTSFEPMSQTELVVGFEQRLGEDWSLGVRGVGRRFNQVIEDILIDKGMWEVYHIPCFDPAILDDNDSCGHDYRLTNPGTDFTGWYDLDGDGVLDQFHLTADQLGVPEAERTYYALELTARRRLADRWMLQASYTWSHSYGDYEGMVSSDFSQVQPYFTKTFDVAALTEHSWGDLPNDRRHNFKLYGMYAFDLGLQVGANFWLRSGKPVNAFGMHPTDPWAQWYGVKAFYNGGEPCPRGCAGTTPSTWNLDLTARYDLKLWGLDWFARVDAFNVFNNDTLVEVDEDAEDETFTSNPSYGMATYFQSPRSIRFGFGVSF